MLNKNIKIKKFNKLLLSINRLIESFFSNIHNFIKEFKKKNSKFKKMEFAKLISKFSKTQVILIEDFNEIGKYMMKNLIDKMGLIFG